MVPQWKQTYLLIIVAGIVVSLAFISFASAFPQEPLQSILLGVGSALLGVCLISLVFDLVLRAEYFSRFQLLLDQDAFGIQGVLENAEDIPFLDKLRQARSVKIMGLALGRLSAEESLELLCEKAEHGFMVKLLIADPRAEAIALRYRDEPVYFQAGLPGIRQRLDVLRALKQRISPDKRANLDIRLFRNYPSMSIAIFDQDLYVYPYGYKVRGIEAPVFHFYGLTRKGASYFNEQFERVFQDATPLEEAPAQTAA